MRFAASAGFEAKERSMSISKTTFLLAALASACLTTAGRAADLASSVAGNLRDSGALTGYRVNVKSKSGTVWLEGRVSDDRQLAAAVGIAETTPGVERVVNRLVIDGAAAGQAQPQAGSLAMPSSAWDTAGVQQPAAPAPAKKSTLASMASAGCVNQRTACAADQTSSDAEAATPEAEATAATTDGDETNADKDADTDEEEEALRAAAHAATARHWAT
jgi:hypothetical protein